MKSKPKKEKDGRGRPKTRTLDNAKIPNTTSEEVAEVLFYRADKNKNN